MNTLNPAGWVRLVMYVLSALVSVAAVVATTLGYEQIASLLGVVAGAGAAVTGGTAVVNLPKAPDQQTAGLDLAALLPAVLSIADAAKVYSKAVSYEPRHSSGEPAGLPIYSGQSTAEVGVAHAD
ncbi:hypothetical protein EU799_11860 [Corynebacterium silvaticum]|uniref:hypothetical protein n=1 Tax=Corynebacterium silvaticum TaxID=2320431 RepID=UPI0010671AB6|nr:hypothetical protein [Corynebacterium silvaticum]MBH5301212.1 hypothetical protein [Corynebacterium silvaticum]NOM65889.1 hypothetical protein [Corynebacterium silvaticum]TFA91329.1 hypothetical protein EU802_11865 [Corynebacterium silvaticum]TFA91991.1 hypothetical protein EU799_11860 [Corynebacterium silvaticum]TNX78337.1 hypothetical protein FIT55_11870 [Corynebacterium silvaticum]